MPTIAPTAIDPLRVRVLNGAAPRGRGEYVLYWMCATRRLDRSFALDRAVEWARHLDRPLLVFDPLRADYRWASARLSTFVVQGMVDNARAAAEAGQLYFPYVERSAGDGKGLLAALAARACVVVCDDYPCFFLPRMTSNAAQHADVLFECVDSNGLLPMRATSDVFPTAYAFRRFLQRTLPAHLDRAPREQPFEGRSIPALDALPHEILEKWPSVDVAPADDTAIARTIGSLSIDPSVRAVETRGGSRAGSATLRRFLRERLARYADERSEPEADAASGLSPYLHFGHVSAHAVFAALASHEGWNLRDLGATRSGKRDGFWSMGGAAESFLDELVTWRELCFNTCVNNASYDRFESLPPWARATLDKHASDPRAHVYTLEELDLSRTHDLLWNAAQSELRVHGRMHNYLRMLWGKKILEWTRSPAEALEFMVELNNRYALDGRDPNSYGGIFWVLGRYDRPWGPERKVFGTVRYMSSDNTARKFDVDGYIRRYRTLVPEQASFEFDPRRGSTSAT